ncbi:MAG: hypothetical protein NC817_00710 [Candidatus Omnitrophica bacterium]|nr:hypothetical protein [Candidatus Omnitrophota bacterium]MCM8823774.1 hypothetical protein [Candidatus Omnitrophota bacterium]MCM8827463.1 hypothetical protein [Candidatus Omnitrophota bacterium]
MNEFKVSLINRWEKLSFLEQIANIGSEIMKAFNWRRGDNSNYAERAFFRALELIDLTLKNTSSFSRKKEIARLREALIDFFLGNNEFNSTENFFFHYFLPFAYAVSKKDNCILDRL